VKQDAVNR